MDNCEMFVEDEYFRQCIYMDLEAKYLQYDNYKYVTAYDGIIFDVYLCDSFNEAYHNRANITIIINKYFNNDTCKQLIKKLDYYTSFLNITSIIWKRKTKQKNTMLLSKYSDMIKLGDLSVYYKIDYMTLHINNNFPDEDNEMILNNIAKNYDITTIEWNKLSKYIPNLSMFKKLKILNVNNRHLLKLNNLPSNLTDLVIYNSQLKSLDNLPVNLKFLICEDKINNLVIPPNCKLL